MPIAIETPIVDLKPAFFSVGSRRMCAAEKSADAAELFWQKVTEAWQAGTFEFFSLTGPEGSGEEMPRRYQLRPVELGGGRQLQWTATDARKRQTHENWAWEPSVARLRELLGTVYASAHLRTLQEEVQIRWAGKRGPQLKSSRRKQPAAAVEATHNQARQYLFPEGKPLPFLVTTGIMNVSGQVRKEKYRKFRQINRFAEFVYDLREELPTDRPVQIVDYGCGKSYLTFAIRQLLVENLGLSVRMRGLDTNPDVIAACEQTKSQLGWTDLEFEVGSIASAEIPGPLDLAIWLHACDTATDEALAKSITAGAELILAVPCCQHELHHQLQNSGLQPLLKHGILRERQASLVTDALRAQLLEVCGYRTQVLEFIDLEHTAKNLLLRARRYQPTAEQKQQAWEQYQEMKSLFQVQQFALETWLGPLL